jgi:hypothetical protein
MMMSNLSFLHSEFLNFGSYPSDFLIFKTDLRFVKPEFLSLSD